MLDFPASYVSLQEGIYVKKNHRFQVFQKNIPPHHDITQRKAENKLSIFSYKTDKVYGYGNPTKSLESWESKVPPPYATTPQEIRPY